MSEIEHWKQVAVRAVEAGGEVVRRHFQQPIEIERKADGSRVTVADRDTEARIREVLTNELPDHGIRGEELDDVRADARRCWVIDPIDGTDSYVNGGHDFGTLLALLEDDEPILGVIYQPVLGELVIGDGRTTLRNGARVQVRACSRIEDAVLLTTDFVNIGRHHDAARFASLSQRVSLCRTWGNCWGYALLAAGFADAMIDPILAEWDILALLPIVRGAGGVITDWHGGDPRHADSIVAAVPQLHGQIVAALNP